jgi:hypothetical protein
LRYLEQHLHWNEAPIKACLSLLGSLTALGVATLLPYVLINKSALALLASSFYLLTNYTQQRN